jgi:hypothetical protein
MHFFALSQVQKGLLAAGAAAFLAFASTPSPAQDEIPNAARLGFVSGNVSIEPASVDSWGQAYPNLPLGPGDRIATDGSGRAEIQIGQTYVRVGPNTDVTFVNDSPAAIVFGLAQGSLHVHAFGFWPNQSLQINSPSGNDTITNPGEYRADVIPAQGVTIYTSFQAPALVNWVDGRGPQTRPIQSGWAIELWGSNPAGSQWLQPAPPDDLDNWSLQRDRMIANAASFRYVSPYIPGAFELDASGDWQPGTPYGAVWFPRGVPGGWAPYHYGHWVNHAPWGWMWVEDESWGYAPFHYGRWVSVGGRWGWIPGPPAARPIFAPALVVFAGGVNFGGVGVSVWFPLGPGEPYRPWYPCPPHYIDVVNISNITPTATVHVQTSYVNIVNVTNVTNITYVNRTIGVTAMNQNDFASGRSAAQVAVKVDPQQLQHVTVLAAPAPKPTAASFIARPAAHAPAVNAQRPALINAEGKLAVAKPGAKPMPPPVKPTAAPKPLPGRTVVAEPGAKPGAPAKAQPEAAKPAAPEAKPENKAGAPAAKPGEKPAAEAGKPAAPAAKPGAPGAKPEEAKPANSGQKTEAKPEDKSKPAAAPGAKPEAKPEDNKAKPATAAGAKPGTTAKPDDKTKPGAKPDDKNKKPEDKKNDEKKPEDKPE